MLRRSFARLPRDEWGAVGREGLSQAIAIQRYNKMVVNESHDNQADSCARFESELII